MNFEDTKKKAEQGFSRAQFALGGRFHRGDGVPQSYTEAVKWYRLAADQGDASAQYRLGGLYFRGVGVPMDYDEAVKLYRLAAEQGYVQAQRRLKEESTK